jgi:hypothetical protein
VSDPFPRFYVQGETVRGEPRVYWVVDRRAEKIITRATRDRRQAWRWRDKLAAGVVPDGCGFTPYRAFSTASSLRSFRCASR